MSTKGISAAKLATAQMEELLQPALEDLRRALEISQRTGVYEDVGAVRAAMTRLKLAIDQAMRIARRAGWPLSPADRRHIVQSLSAGIAQRERRASLPEMAVSNPPPAPSSGRGDPCTVLVLPVVRIARDESVEVALGRNRRRRQRMENDEATP